MLPPAAYDIGPVPGIILVVMPSLNYDSCDRDDGRMGPAQMRTVLSKSIRHPALRPGSDESLFRLLHGPGLGQAEDELAVVLVSGVADHLVLGARVEVAQAPLQYAGIEQRGASGKTECLRRDVQRYVR